MTPLVWLLIGAAIFVTTLAPVVIIAIAKRAERHSAPPQATRNKTSGRMK
ncbi:hypothetical protein K3728_06590 [Rhodobacteraceae bacterium M385]|nr:hypothetical protein K3728_06590 [Rhodobacteraceae bacterium M385]